MYELYLRHKHLVDRAAFFILITAAVYVFFTFLFEYLSPFFFGLVIALIMEPLIRLLTTRLNWKRWASALLCLFLFIGATSSLGVWLVSTLVRQGVAFVESAPVHIDEFLAIMDAANVWLQRWEVFLPETMYMPDIQEMALTAVTALFGGAVRDQGWWLATTVPNLFINLILTLVSAYFFMADRETIFTAVKNACPRWLAKQMRKTRKGLRRAMAGYFRAQYILMAMVGIISIIGLLILGNDYALLLGILLAVLDFLPILGTGTVLLPWALISIIMGNFNQAIGLGVIYGIITVARQVLQPKILGDQMGAHPLASLMSIFIGFRIFGLLGLIIGPSLLMMFIAIREVEGE